MVRVISTVTLTPCVRHEGGASVLAIEELETRSRARGRGCVLLESVVHRGAPLVAPPCVVAITP